MKHSIKNKFQSLVRGVQFAEAKAFYWSPGQSTVYYNPQTIDHPEGQWALLHEIAHAKLGHTLYTSDIELLQLEVHAWEEAKELAGVLELRISTNHVQDCLDTYRDWLYARSTCPTCSLNGLQTAVTTYKCLNCQTSWRVSASRFCRPYRMQARHKKTPSEISQTVFK